MVTKKVTTRKKVVAPPAPPVASPAAKGVPTAAIGLGMVVLTNYQAEVKQVLSLLLKAVM